MRGGRGGRGGGRGRGGEGRGERGRQGGKSVRDGRVSKRNPNPPSNSTTNVPLEDDKKGIKSVQCFLATSAKQVVLMTIPSIP
ncbi:Methyltransferase sdnD [Frankliniella fusca]|uniref:Methyltransferase sdnD n=1 Tax=Frankliniella fusca TaxID=407009 RepID=A0AAE1LSX2_9NEOP|nr:Methyltransferase sdnD [Frankliniella fusca]